MATQRPPRTHKSKTTSGEVTVPVNRLKSLQAEIAELMHDGVGEKDDVASKRHVGDGAAVGVQIDIWEDDPFLEAIDGHDPVPAEPITVDLPVNNSPTLKTQILGPEPPAEIYPPASLEFVFWNAEACLARTIDFWSAVIPAGTQWSADQSPLQVDLDKGEDFNAFYARQSGLNFFHGLVDKVDPSVTVLSGASPDVVCHELGHAILDAVKPELFDAMSMEVAAFHEGFADCSAMLSALQLPTFREFVLEQTAGNLNANSRLSQLARQLGWVIRVQINPSAVDADSLRNACNSFFYQDPMGLPPNAPATQLSSEPHSFSRVFSGAFLDVLGRMFRVGPAGSSASDSDKLEAITKDAGRLLIEGVRLASVGPGFYSQVAAGMIQADQTLNGGRYQTALSSSFVHRGILSPSAAVNLAGDLRSHGGKAFGITGVVPGARQLEFEGDNEGYKREGKDLPALPLRPLMTRFGVTLHVHMPAEPNRFAVAAAAVTGGSDKTFSAEEDAQSFVEDLIQLDRVAHDNVPDGLPAALIAPQAASARKTVSCKKTHVLVREDGKTILKRHHFDCGFCGCQHDR